MERAAFLTDCLHKVDHATPSEQLKKHIKMATSPFIFFRGSAPLFYADISAGNLTLPSPLLAMPNTTIMGDCHTANFGFLTEEGSHGDKVIFSPNDFDDACIGPAVWDIARYICSVFLATIHCQLLKNKEITSKKDHSHKVVADLALAKQVAQHFISEYVSTAKQCIEIEDFRYRALSTFCEQHLLYKHLIKAKRRAANGELFLSKSALAKAITIKENSIAFNNNPEKFATLKKAEYQAVAQTFRPYVDDHIHDIVLRLNAGTGSVNMARYYLLVGPKQAPAQQLTLCHIVEVKQQRQAAPLYYFEHTSPINQLNAAHLTVSCQRRMQRSPDLVLDEVEWQNAHWLVRSRHHAKVGIDPEHIALGKKAVLQGGFIDYAKACASALALAHCRGDRRSTLFEQAIVSTLPEHADALIETCYQYAQQVQSDSETLKALLNGN